MPEVVYPTLVELFIENDMQPGFWVVRKTWRTTCARVKHVGPVDGDLPSFGYPRVFGDVYKRVEGRILSANVELQCSAAPGIWWKIAEPLWFTRTKGLQAVH